MGAGSRIVAVITPDTSEEEGIMDMKYAVVISLDTGKRGHHSWALENADPVNWGCCRNR